MLENKPDAIIYVIDTINDLYLKKFNRDPINYFTTKGCYVFALILQELIPEAILMNSDSHVVLKIGNHLYDATGMLRGKELTIENFAETKEESLIHLEVALLPDRGERKEVDIIMTYLIEKTIPLVERLNKYNEQRKTK